MSRSQHTHSLVVGAGPVGLFAANSLASRNIPFRIIDNAWRTGAHSYALAVHRQNLTLFSKLDLLRPIMEAACAVHTIGLYHGTERYTTLNISQPDDAIPFLAILRQDTLEGILEHMLKKRGTKVEWECQLSGFGQDSHMVSASIQRVTLDSIGYAVAHMERVIAGTETIDAQFLIGADGHNSTVRRSMNLPFHAVGDTEYFAVFECRTSADLGSEVRIMLDEESTSVLWPLPGGFCRWSFQLPSFDAEGTGRRKDRNPFQVGEPRFPELKEEYLHKLVANRAPWFSGTLEDVTWRIVVRFEQRLVQAFGRGRSWLVGDAAHLAGPVGVQSMNAGFREAQALVDVIANSKAKEAPEHEFDRYNRECISKWLTLLGLDDAITVKADCDSWIKEKKKRILSCIPASGDDFCAILKQLGLTC